MYNSEASSVRNNYIVTYSLPNSPIWRHAIVLADSGRAAQQSFMASWTEEAREKIVVMSVEVMRSGVYLVD